MLFRCVNSWLYQAYDGMQGGSHLLESMTMVNVQSQRHTVDGIHFFDNSSRTLIQHYSATLRTLRVSLPLYSKHYCHMMSQYTLYS